MVTVKDRLQVAIGKIADKSFEAGQWCEAGGDEYDAAIDDVAALVVDTNMLIKKLKEGEDDVA